MAATGNCRCCLLHAANHALKTSVVGRTRVQPHWFDTRHTSTLVQFCAKGSSTAISPSVAPNSAYARRCAQTRARSASPVLRRVVLPMDVSVARRRVQLATQTAESAMSGVGRVAEETQHARSVAEAAIAEVAAASSRMEQKVASIAAQVEKQPFKQFRNLLSAFVRR